MDDRDPVVARALASVQPPPHRADFWQRLDRSLAQVPSPRAVQSPNTHAPAPQPAPPRDDDTTVVELHREADDHRGGRGGHGGQGGHRRRARRAARFPLRVLASAAVIVAVVVAGVWVAGRGDDELGPDLSTAGPTGTVAESSAPTGAPETSATATTEPAEGKPEHAVLELVDALGAGDAERVKSVLGPRSEQTITEQWGSVDAYVAEASEGYGAWSAAEDLTVDVIELREGEAIVVLRGTIRPEGMEEHRVDAFPTRRTESAGVYWFVEPLASYDPEAHPPIALEPDGTELVVTNGEPIVLRTPTAGTAYFSLGGQPAVAVETQSSGTGHRATWTPDDAPAGPSLLTVAFVSDTHFTALARDVTVR